MNYSKIFKNIATQGLIKNIHQLNYNIIIRTYLWFFCFLPKEKSLICSDLCFIHQKVSDRLQLTDFSSCWALEKVLSALIVWPLFLYYFYPLIPPQTERTYEFSQAPELVLCCTNMQVTAHSSRMYVPPPVCATSQTEILCHLTCGLYCSWGRMSSSWFYFWGLEGRVRRRECFSWKRILSVFF